MANLTPSQKRKSYRSAQKNKGKDRITKEDIQRGDIMGSFDPYISEKKGGGMAIRGMGAALKGGGMALQGMGAAYKKGGLNKKNLKKAALVGAGLLASNYLGKRAGVEDSVEAINSREAFKPGGAKISKFGISFRKGGMNKKK